MFDEPCGKLTFFESYKEVYRKVHRTQDQAAIQQSSHWGKNDSSNSGTIRERLHIFEEQWTNYKRKEGAVVLNNVLKFEMGSWSHHLILHYLGFHTMVMVMLCL